MVLSARQSKHLISVETTWSLKTIQLLLISITNEFVRMNNPHDHMSNVHPLISIRPRMLIPHGSINADDWADETGSVTCVLLGNIIIPLAIHIVWLPPTCLSSILATSMLWHILNDPAVQCGKVLEIWDSCDRLPNPSSPTSPHLPTVTVSSSVYINASSSPPCPMLFSPILLFLFWFCFQREAVTMNNTYQPNNQRITLWCVWINFDADHSEPRLHMDQLSPCKLLTLRAPNFCFSHYQGQEATFLKQKMCAWSTPTILGRSTEVLFDLWSTICVILNLRSIYNERSGWLPFVGNTRSITRERHCAILSC